MQTPPQETTASVSEQMLELMHELKKLVDPHITTATTADDLEHLIADILEQYPDHSLNVDLALKLTLDNQLSSLKWPSKAVEESLKNVVNTTLKSSMTHEDQTIFDDLFKIVDNLNKLIEPIKRLLVESEAHEHRQTRERSRMERLKHWVELYDDKIVDESSLYLDFLKTITPSNPLTPERLEAFVQSLPEPPSPIEQLILQIRRKAASWISEMIMKGSTTLSAHSK